MSSTVPRTATEIAVCLRGHRDAGDFDLIGADHDLGGASRCVLSGSSTTAPHRRRRSRTVAAGRNVSRAIARGSASRARGSVRRDVVTEQSRAGSTPGMVVRAPYSRMWPKISGPRESSAGAAGPCGSQVSLTPVRRINFPSRWRRFPPSPLACRQLTDLRPGRESSSSGSPCCRTRRRAEDDGGVVCHLLGLGDLGGGKAHPSAERLCHNPAPGFDSVRPRRIPWGN